MIESCCFDNFEESFHSCSCAKLYRVMHQIESTHSLSSGCVISLKPINPTVKSISVVYGKWVVFSFYFIFLIPSNKLNTLGELQTKCLGLQFLPAQQGSWLVFRCSLKVCFFVFPPHPGLQWECKLRKKLGCSSEHARRPSAGKASLQLLLGPHEVGPVGASVLAANDGCL